MKANDPSAPAGFRGHLLIRAPNWVGDLVMATPILEAALADPRFSQVTIALRAHLAGVLSDGPLAPRVLALSREEPEHLQLRRVGADLALLLSSSLGAALRAWRAGIAERVGSGLSGRRLFLTRRFTPPTRDGRRLPTPTAHLLRDVAGLIGLRPADLHPRLDVGEDCAARARELLARAGSPPGRPYLLCCPGAAYGAAKLWPAERFARVLDELGGERDLGAVITGSPAEGPLVEAVARACRRPAVSLAAAPGGLDTLKALVRDAQLLLVGDSGPRWYAAAFDVPCVSVMGPNSPELTASSLEWCEVLRVEDLVCSPCMQRRCPLGHHRCMTELEPDPVLAAARRLLERAERERQPAG